MRTTIDRAGRVIIPKAVRDAAGLRGEGVVEIRCRNGVVEIQAAPMEVRLVRKGLFKVAMPVEKVEPLSPGEVEATRERLLEERAGASGVD